MKRKTIFYLYNPYGTKIYKQRKKENMMININPILLHLGPLEIRWYGVILVLMFMIGIFIAIHLAKSRKIKKEDILDFMPYLIISSILMARIFHVFVYNFGYYQQHPWLMLAIWKGGISVHGGVLGGILAALIYCKKRKIVFYDLADILVIPLSFGVIFGRMGNLINQELYGKLTTLPWGITFSTIPGKRHPSQIYEAITHAITFSVLLYLYKLKSLPKGFIFWSFVTLYSFFRFMTEFFRDQATTLFGLSTAQLMSIVLFILGSIFLWKIFKIPKPEHL